MRNDLRVSVPFFRSEVMGLLYRHGQMLPDPTLKLNTNAVVLRKGFLRDNCLIPWRKYITIGHGDPGQTTSSNTRHYALRLALLPHDTQTSSPRQCPTIAVDIFLIPWLMNARPLFATMVLSFNLLYEAASYVLHPFLGRDISAVASTKLPHSCWYFVSEKSSVPL